jgi:HEAT repeat protein
MSRGKRAQGSAARKTGERPTTHMESLMSDLTCKDVFQCRRARRELVLMGEQAVPNLEDALAHRKGWIRWEAAKALGEIEGEAATAALVRALEDRNFDVRWLAAEGLIRRGKLALPPLLRALIKNAESAYLRDGAHHVLHDIQEQQVRKLAEPLLLKLEDVDSAVMVPPMARSLLASIQREGR